jgi:hypothetical protein
LETSTLKRAVAVLTQQYRRMFSAVATLYKRSAMSRIRTENQLYCRSESVVLKRSSKVVDQDWFSELPSGFTGSVGCACAGGKLPCKQVAQHMQLLTPFFNYCRTMSFQVTFERSSYSKSFKRHHIYCYDFFITRKLKHCL